jgi:poly(3-hydroxybutyrate) depolymerase
MRLRLVLTAVLIPCCLGSAWAKPSVSKSATAVAALEAWLALGERPALSEQPFAGVALTKEDAARAKALLWKDHEATIRKTRTEEMKQQAIKLGDLTMRFRTRTYGEKPASGRSLYISMHGGGGAPPAVNDQQWKNQIGLYEPAEGIYLAPRAPTDTWNLWHQAHIDQFFRRLIENLIVLEDVNPDRVYILGYSAGGDGVYQLAPRMADSLAAASMMAGHPNETSPLGLRNLPFALQVGARDGGYKRNEIAATWAEKLKALHAADPGGYETFIKIHEGKGHWMDREDAVALPWMAKHTRSPLPKRIVWKQDDVRHDRFYWLAVDPASQGKRAELVATREGQTITVSGADTKRVTVLLNDEMLDLDQPVTIRSGSKPLYRGAVLRTIGGIARTLEARGDPRLVFSGEQTVTLPSDQDPVPAK